MTTEAQINANRQNAKKSTGPKTAKGKAKVARNAIKHGLCSLEAVIRGEEQEEYERHRGTFQCLCWRSEDEAGSGSVSRRASRR